jgi:peptidoglycan/LPS O-acetylase OafA/YrhL
MASTTTESTTSTSSTDTTAAHQAGGPQHPSRLSGADGLRALAALGVVFSHLFQRLGMEDQSPVLAAIQGIMMKGAYGVSIFFVLSGMLLSLPFWKAYLDGSPRPSIGHYARRRFARIAPGYWASLLVSFVVGFLIFTDIQAPVLRLLSGATFTSGFHYLTFFPTESNGPLWSISLEVFSYVLMPLVMIAMFALGRRGYRFSVWFWVGVFALVIAVNQVVITVFQTDAVGKGWQYGIVGGAKEWMPYYNPVGFFGHFTIGIIAAGVIAWWQVRGGRRLWRFDVIGVAGLAGIAALVLLTMFPLEPRYMENPFQSQPFLFPVLAAFAAMALVGMSHSRLVGRLLDNRFFRYTATVSFGLYIWHYLLLHLMVDLTDGEFVYGGVQNPARFAWMSVTVLVLAYAVATVSWKFLEKPVLKSKWANKI